MLIGIEAARANRVEKTGVEWYVWHLIQALKQTPGQEAQAWLLYAEQSLTAELGELPVNWHERPLAWFPKYLWTQLRLSIELFQHKPDVLFVPAHALPRVLPRRSVVTVHDVGFFRFPQFYSGAQRFWQTLATRDMVRRATRVLTVSEYSKQEIVHYCDVNPDRISVVYPGVDHIGTAEVTEFEKQDVINRYRISGQYFLYVGRLESKKNLVTLIEAFRRYKEDRGLGDPVSLVLAGSPGEGYAEIQAAIQRTALGEAIIQTGYVAEEDKRALLAGALALVHPSWYEGFGFTPLEAMMMQCPVVCSRAGSLPEVVGIDNALWFDPSDPEALAQCLDHVVRDEVLRQTLRMQGSAWAARYTWKETAVQTLELLTHWGPR